MHDDHLFMQAFVYLAAAVVAVPVAKRLGLGSVLGYLMAGMLIGPYGLGLVGEEGKDVLHFAEFGVVMMLFVVGLELEPSLLWRMRTPVLGMGGLQVLFSAILGGGLGLVLGLPWQEALAIGLVLSLSSTAIVLQTLQEKGLMSTAAGRGSFAILLFQDIAVIPMLALFPLLALHAPEALPDAHEAGVMAGLPGWAQGLALLCAVSAVVLGGRFLMRPTFRWVARTGLRELFVALVLLLVIGIALLMDLVGLSPALGTFVAGVVLAESEYRHELESDIEPFKGLLLGLFFIAVGASVDFPLVAEEPGTIAGLVGLLVLVKLAVLFAVGRIFRLSLDQNLLMSFALAQGGEFAFVLFSFAVRAGVLEASTSAPLVAAVALSMALTPLLLVFFDRVVRPRVGTREAERSYDAPEEASVIIAGFGRFGQICSRLLEAEGVHATILEADSDQVDLLRKFGRKVFYGDASRLDLLHAAGAEQARLLVLAVDRSDKTKEIVQTVQRHFPDLPIMARASGRNEAYDLVSMGVQHVYRETFDSALRMGTDALVLLGSRAHRAHRAGARFRRQDEALVRELAGLRGQQDFVDIVRRRTKDVEQILKRDLEGAPVEGAGWDASPLRGDPALTPLESVESSASPSE